MKKKAYLTLSKLLQHQIRTQRAEASLLFSREDALAQQMADLEQTLITEHAFALKHPSLRATFEMFRKDLAHKQFMNGQERRAFHQQLTAIQDKLHTLFQQAKSYEIPYERFEEKKRADALKREQNRLDETASNQLRHKKLSPTQVPPPPPPFSAF